MGKLAGRQKRRNSSRTKKHIRPVQGVDVANQNVDLIIRKVDPSEMTKTQHPLANSPFRRKDLKT